MNKSPVNTEVQAINYILNLVPRECPRCDKPDGARAVETYHVTRHTKKVTVKVACHKSRHPLGTSTMNLTEVEFIEKTEPWKRKGGPRLPGGPKRG